MQTHIIRFLVDYSVGYEGGGKLYIAKGDVVGCCISPDGPGCEEQDKRYCCDVFITGGFMLWNVPDDNFQIMVGRAVKHEDHLYL